MLVFESNSNMLKLSITADEFSLAARAKTHVEAETLKRFLGIDLDSTVATVRFNR